MQKVIEFLKGKKTYILAFAGGIYATAVGCGLLPNSNVIWGLLGAGGLAAVRAGISKAGDN